MGVQTTARGPNVIHHPVNIGPHKILKMQLCIIYVFIDIVNFCKRWRKHSITATIEGNVFDFI